MGQFATIDAIDCGSPAAPPAASNGIEIGCEHYSMNAQRRIS